jgi:hypothetical protein
MSIRKSLWIPLLAGLLTGGVLWAATGGVTAAPEARAVNRSVSIPAAAFTPAADGYDFEHNGDYLYSSLGTFFKAPVFFEAPEVKIRKIVLYARDEGSDNICLSLRRVVVKDQDQEQMATVCSEGAAVGNRKFIQKQVNRKWVKEAHGPYLALYLPDNDLGPYRFQGAQIFYTIP